MSSSSSRNRTQTTDQRTTETLNAGIGGDIDDSYVISGNRGNTSLSTAYVEANQNYEYSDNSDRSFTDNADNSFNLDYSDTRDQSQTFDYEDSSDNSGQINLAEGAQYTINTTDGGAFALLEKIGSNFMESQRETLAAAEDLTRQSINNAFAIKAGEALNQRADSDMNAKLKTAATVTAILGVAYVAGKSIRGRA